MAGMMNGESVKGEMRELGCNGPLILMNKLHVLLDKTRLQYQHIGLYKHVLLGKHEILNSICVCLTKMWEVTILYVWDHR